MSFNKCSIAMLLGVASLASQAAQQCFTTAGTYGAVTITESAGCVAPFTYGPRNGLVVMTGDSCTIGFNKPITTSTVSIEVDSVSAAVNEVTTLSTSAGPYTVVTADITTPLSGGDPGNIVESAGKIGGTGSGTFRFTNSPPATITSLTLALSGAFNEGVFYKVCADDVTAPASAIPTLSEWGMIILSLLIAGFAVYQQRRRQS